MESLDRSKAVIELGKRIVAQMKLGDDVVAQWMAHEVAEKIAAAEQAIGDARDAAVDNCVEAVLKLWANRYTLPPYFRPLRELEPLLRTLTSLGVDDAYGPRYFTHVPSEEQLDGATDEEKKLLGSALAIDRAAKELIRYFISVAAQRPTEAAKQVLVDAVKGGLDVEIELTVSKHFSDRFSKIKEKAQQDAIRSRIEKLEGFADAAQLLANEMKKTLREEDDTRRG